MTVALESVAREILELVGTPGAGEVALAPPGDGPGFWAGGPSAVYADGVYWLAYRLRRPVDKGRGYANVVARSDDGVHFETVATVTSEQFDCASLERPALVPLADGGWRLFVSCSTWHSKHWWVESLDASSAEKLAEGTRTMILAGDADTAWKDIVVSRDGSSGTDVWRMWACRHPLDGGDENADRMTSWFASSSDGLDWTLEQAALVPDDTSTADTVEWDARGTRIASVIGAGNDWVAFYDGRKNAAENWHERTGIAVGPSPDSFTRLAGPTPPGRTVRYLSLAELPDGYRVYWETSRPDGAHELRTAYVSRATSSSQS